MKRSASTFAALAMCFHIVYVVWGFQSHSPLFALPLVRIATEQIHHRDSRYEKSLLLLTRKKKCNELCATVSSAQEEGVAVVEERLHEETPTAVFFVPHNGDEIPSQFGSGSPVKNPSILEAARQLARKVDWFSDGKVKAFIVSAEGDTNLLTKQLMDADVLIAFHTTATEVDFLSKIFKARRKSTDISKRSRMCQFALESATDLSPLVGPYDSATPSISSQLLPWTSGAAGKRMQDEMIGLFNRWTSDDFTVALMLFFNQFSGIGIDWVKHSIDATWEKGIVRNAKEFYSMMTKCGDCITKCLADENCRECVNALNAVNSSDQVATYRTIVSYESELLKDFSFCILQKNNIFNCDAKIPTIPKVNPITAWRGIPLTTEAAKSILIAHLDEDDAPEGGLKSDVSWKVACGANVAYDQFPSQSQLFYKNVSGRDMWYDPVFRVETIDGRNVWCKRHYKVRNGPVPGTFKLSVLDNGVTSNEFWTIVGVADDLSWIVFHYAGAASAVGLRYLGGLVCTADGTLPTEEVKEEIWTVLRSAGIEPWELSVVDNSPDSPGAIEAGEPPLNFYRKEVMSKKSAKLVANQQ